jgi:hypothetical protein
MVWQIWRQDRKIDEQTERHKDWKIYGQADGERTDKKTDRQTDVEKENSGEMQTDR